MTTHWAATGPPDHACMRVTGWGSRGLGRSPSGVWGRAPARCGAEPREENVGQFRTKSAKNTPKSSPKEEGAHTEQTRSRAIVVLVLVLTLQPASVAQRELVALLLQSHDSSHACARVLELVCDALKPLVRVSFLYSACARNALDSLLRLFCVADQPFASLRRKSEALCQSQKLKTISCTCSKQLQNAAIAAAEAANLRTSVLACFEWLKLARTCICTVKVRTRQKATPKLQLFARP